MKHKSTSRSAYLNLRVLIALVLILAGVFVALFATSAPGRTRRGEANSSPGVRLGSDVFSNVLAEPSGEEEPAGWFWQNPLPQGNDLRGASFIDANTGTVVGYYGTIVRTTDGGNNWRIQTSGTTENLWAVSFSDADNGTAVGEGGTILRTTDGGNHWVSQASGTTGCRRRAGPLIGSMPSTSAMKIMAWLSASSMEKLSGQPMVDKTGLLKTARQAASLEFILPTRIPGPWLATTARS